MSSNGYTIKDVNNIKQLRYAISLVKKAKGLVENLKPLNDETLSEFLNLSFYGLICVCMNLDSALNIFQSILNDASELKP